jgi:hypothetical protein
MHCNKCTTAKAVISPGDSLSFSPLVPHAESFVRYIYDFRAPYGLPPRNTLVQTEGLSHWIVLLVGSTLSTGGSDGHSESVV